MILDKILLFPYYLTLLCRDALYRGGVWSSYSSSIPTLCVGNVTVGGTGKTPMVELLLRLLSNGRRVAVVSRGYKRKSKGMKVVETSDSYLEVGDEPLQIKKKYEDVTVVVDTSRKHALEYLEALPEKERPELIILDDAFQHRKISPTCSIVLVDSNRPTYSDSLLPIGRLRDLPERVSDADIVVITKNRNEINREIREEWREKLGLPGEKPLLFSRISYSFPRPIFPKEGDGRYSYSKKAVIFTGIADDRSMKRELGWSYEILASIRYPDHHRFGAKDIKAIETMARKHPTAIVVTTEKDAQRLINPDIVPKELKERLFYIPIFTEVIPDVPQGKYIEEELPLIGDRELADAVFENTDLKVVEDNNVQ